MSQQATKFLRWVVGQCEALHDGGLTLDQRIRAAAALVPYEDKDEEPPNADAVTTADVLKRQARPSSDKPTRPIF